jgi:hypothetical protein
MKEFLDNTKKAVSSGVESLKSELDSGMKIVKDVAGGLPVLVSTERSENSSIKWDEKHYFVIPNHTSKAGFSLHTMRSLPSSVLEVNDLPKRRIFHFPNEHYEGKLRKYMLDAARNMAYESSSQNKSTLEKLADDIDSLDSKLTYGMLFIGGIAAIFNPLIGAGIAAKALLPSISGTFAKHGLKPIGEKATRSQIEKQAKAAEEYVLKQFSESTTLKVVNPILKELEFALRTTEQEHDPLSDPNLADGSIVELENEDWRNLTELAISHVYKDILNDKSKHEKARLGPEDIRWLQVLLAGKLD